jgi:hypothetical protein
MENIQRELVGSQGLPKPEWLLPTLPDDIVAALGRAKEKEEQIMAFQSTPKLV